MRVSASGATVAALLPTHFRQAPTPYHTTAYLRSLAEARGFVLLDEREPWQINPLDKVMVIREGSIFFLAMGDTPPAQAGVHLIGAHTDSPTYKVRPNPMITAGGMQLLNVEPYGSPIHSSWHDRDLSVAGRVILKDGSVRLVNLDQSVARMANLAIHLTDYDETKTAFNPQTRGRPLWGMAGDPTLYELIGTTHDLDPDAILAHDLSLVLNDPPSVTGAGANLFSSARQDNLLGVFTAFHALLDAIDAQPVTPFGRGLVCYDFEEVGSDATTGAAGPFLQDCLHRIIGLPDGEDYYRMVANSAMVSLDVAHGFHPNYAERYDEHHHPLLGGGPALKINANQSYATTGLTEGWAKMAAEAAGVPLQVFVSRSDQRCGSTIGPVTATRVGLPIVDIGQPIIGMHSARELSHLGDADTTTALLTASLNLAVTPHD